jgi:hypothetical protein
MEIPFEQALANKQQERHSQLVAQRKKRQEEVPADALLWLALAPEWTAPLAEAAGFPTGAPLCKTGWTSSCRKIFAGSRRPRLS